MCKPNAGVPVIGEDGIPKYSLSPDEFSDIVAECAQMGATFLGGCCGTAPEFIAAVKSKV
jgi:5-methyltetrahydrofolate--homocysteine methyltransferase